MAYDPNVFPKMSQEIEEAISALQEAAILNGEGQCKYSVMSDRRRTLVSKIADALYRGTREAYFAGVEKSDTGAAQVTK